jgi:hypothetical protein
MNTGVLKKIEETPGFNHLSKDFLFDTMEGMIRIFMEIENAQPFSPMPDGIPIRR